MSRRYHMKRQNKHFRCRGQFSCQLVLQPSPRVTAAFCNYAPRWNRNSLLTLLRHFSRVTPTAGKQSTRSTFGMSLGHISPPMFTLSSSKHQGIPISSAHHTQPRAKHASLQQCAAQRLYARMCVNTAASTSTSRADASSGTQCFDIIKFLSLRHRSQFHSYSSRVSSA